tara:strand:+ start:102 stop:761 length:660 start_codon:yes stop_codon:yes gene_type:complete
MGKRGPYKTGSGHGNSIDSKAKKHAIGYICVWKLVNSAIKKAKKNAKTRQNFAVQSEETRLKKLAATAAWQAGNGKDKKREYTNNYFLERRDRDPEFRLACDLRTRVREGLKYQGTNKRGQHTFGKGSLTGCTKREFHKHIASTFKDGMRADNTDVDHIWPLALYRLKDAKQQKMAFNWKNCRAAWPFDNKSKKDKPPEKELALTVPRHLWPPGFEDYY